MKCSYWFYIKWPKGSVELNKVLSIPFCPPVGINVSLDGCSFTVEKELGWDANDQGLSIKLSDYSFGTEKKALAEIKCWKKDGWLTPFWKE